MADAVDEIERIETFLDLVRNGSAPLVAALAVKWTPIHLRKLRKDPDFVQLLDDAEDHLIAQVETTVFQRAIAGNRWAAEMVLYNKRPEFWRPPAHKIAITNDTKVTHEVVLATTAAARALLMEEGAVAALQRAVIDVDVRED